MSILDLFASRLVEAGKKEQIQRIFNHIRSHPHTNYVFGAFWAEYDYLVEQQGEREGGRLNKKVLTRLIEEWYLNPIKELDPTGKSYVDQILTWWFNGSIAGRFQEDAEQVREQLGIFDRFKGSERIPRANINDYKKFSDLAAVTLPIGQQARVTKYTPDDQFTDEEGNEYKLFITDDAKQAKDLGEGTTWCIQQPKYWSMYKDNAPVSIVTVNDKPEYGIALGGYEGDWEVQTPENRQHEYGSRNKINHWLWKIYEESGVIDRKMQHYEKRVVDMTDEEIKQYREWEYDGDFDAIEEWTNGHTRKYRGPVSLYSFAADMDARAPIEIEKAIVAETDPSRDMNFYGNQATPDFLISSYMGRVLERAFDTEKNPSVKGFEHFAPFVGSGHWGTMKAWGDLEGSDKNVLAEAAAYLIAKNFRPDPRSMSDFVHKHFGGDMPPDMYQAVMSREPDYIKRVMQYYTGVGRVRECYLCTTLSEDQQTVYHGDEEICPRDISQVGQVPEQDVQMQEQQDAY